MSNDLRRRLERLDRGPKRKRERSRPRAAPRDLPDGEQVESPEGHAYRIDSHYASDYRHGQHPLEEVLSYPPRLAAEVASDAGLERSTIERWGYIDIETTGLSGGAGTLGFLIGLGTFQADGFLLRQYFLRDPEEEAAALQLLREDLADVEGLVTFNGRTFDLPVLESRYIIALRDRWKLSLQPHLDLLYPSRRLWSKTLANCRLGTLEQQVLLVERSEEDVPGELIPGMYLDYLRTGDASDMTRVIYHNAVDILSLVGLSSVVLGRHVEKDLSGGEALAVARWHEAAGRVEEAESAYQLAVSEAPNKALGSEALKHQGALLKKDQRRLEAVPTWEEWHRLAPDDPTPCIEIAMYYEWEAKDLPEALKWAGAAKAAVKRWPKGWRRDERLAEIEHRIRRLERKRSRA